MNTSPPPGRRLALDLASVAARWVLAGFFLGLGLEKAMHPVEFLKLVRQYELTQNTVLLDSIAAGLPWFEVFCGLLLLAGVAVRGTAVMLIGLLVPFSIAVLRRALELQATRHLAFCAVKFDCGCGNGEVFICGKLLENAGFLLLAAWLLAGRGRQFCARFALFPPGTGNQPGQA